MDTPRSHQRGPFGDSAAASSATSVSEFPIDRISANGERAPRPVKNAFKSQKLQGEYERPWVSDKRMKRVRIGNWIIWGFIALGLLISAYINFAITRKVTNHEYCLILDDHFSSIDSGVWNHEVQVNGFGTGSFDWTTTDPKNAFTDGDGLHIVPTLTTESTPITRDQIYDGFSLNLTKSAGDGTCTGKTYMECSVRSNGTTGSIIPPVRSARLNTRGKKSIRYGKVEVVAKMPRGDWLWPAIWMMPEENTYGDWPASGEIDIAESRGNAAGYEMGGNDIFSSTLHWGPTSSTNAFWRTTRGRDIRRTDFTKGYHLFGIEWSEKYLFTYMDSRLQQVLYWNFDVGQTMWQRGEFATAQENSSLIADPWTKTGRLNTPFDQNFYLILNVAVGSRNGWFLDSKGGKPWTDASNEAPSQFYKAFDQWYPTWAQGNDRGMTVKSVKMWQEGKCA